MFLLFKWLWNCPHKFLQNSTCSKIVSFWVGIWVWHWVWHLSMAEYGTSASDPLVGLLSVKWVRILSLAWRCGSSRRSLSTERVWISSCEVEWVALGFCAFVPRILNLVQMSCTCAAEWVSVLEPKPEAVETGPTVLRPIWEISQILLSCKSAARKKWVTANPTWPAYISAGFTYIGQGITEFCLVSLVDSGFCWASVVDSGF